MQTHFNYQSYASEYPCFSTSKPHPFAHWVTIIRIDSQNVALLSLHWGHDHRWRQEEARLDHSFSSDQNSAALRSIQLWPIVLGRRVVFCSAVFAPCSRLPEACALTGQTPRSFWGTSASPRSPNSIQDEIQRCHTRWPEPSVSLFRSQSLSYHGARFLSISAYPLLIFGCVLSGPATTAILGGSGSYQAAMFILLSTCALDSSLQPLYFFDLSYYLS